MVLRCAYIMWCVCRFLHRLNLTFLVFCVVNTLVYYMPVLYIICLYWCTSRICSDTTVALVCGSFVSVYMCMWISELQYTHVWYQQLETSVHSLLLANICMQVHAHYTAVMWFA